MSGKRTQKFRDRENWCSLFEASKQGSARDLLTLAGGDGAGLPAEGHYGPAIRTAEAPLTTLEPRVFAPTVESCHVPAASFSEIILRSSSQPTVEVFCGIFTCHFTRLPKILPLQPSFQENLQSPSLARQRSGVCYKFTLLMDALRPGSALPQPFQNSLLPC